MGVPYRATGFAKCPADDRTWRAWGLDGVEIHCLEDAKIPAKCAFTAALSGSSVPDQRRRDPFDRGCKDWGDPETGTTDRGFGYLLRVAGGRGWQSILLQP